MKFTYENSPAKLCAKTPSRYNLKYDNVSNLNVSLKAEM